MITDDDIELVMRGLTRVGELAGELAQVLSRAYARGRTCDCDASYTYIHTCKCQFMGRRGQGRCGHDPIRVYSDTCSCPVGIRYYHARGQDVDHAFTCVHDLERACVRTHDLLAGSGLEGALTVVLEHIQAVRQSLCGAPSWRVDGAIGEAMERTAALHSTLANTALLVESVTVVPAASAAAVATRSARSLVEVAVRSLPAMSRSRYLEEFHAELNDLAGRSRRRQWMFAFRLVVHCVTLRRVLVESASCVPETSQDGE